MSPIRTVMLDLVPYSAAVPSSWVTIAGALLTFRGAASLTIAAALVSLPWTRSLARSLAGSMTTIGAVLAVLMAWTLSPFLLAICIPPALYGFAQGAHWATSRGHRLGWCIPVMDGRARTDLLQGACWFWLGVCCVGVGFRFAFLLNPTGKCLAALRYDAIHVALLFAWIVALLVGYGVAVHSLAALVRGFLGVTRVLRSPSRARTMT